MFGTQIYLKTSVAEMFCFAIYFEFHRMWNRPKFRNKIKFKFKRHEYFCCIYKCHYCIHSIEMGDCCKHGNVGNTLTFI